MNEARKNLKWLFVGFAVLAATAVGIFLLIAWQAGQQLEQKIAALQAAGEPVSIADYAPLPQPPTLNADTYLRQARADVQAIKAEVEAVETTLSAAEQSAFWDSRPSSDMLKTLRTILVAHADAFPLIQQASHCRVYQPPLSYTLAPDDFWSSDALNLEANQAVRQALHDQMLVQLADGAREEALELCLTMFRLARLFDKGPPAIGHLLAAAVRSEATRDANRVLQFGPLSESAHAALEAELALHNIWEAFRQEVRQTRVYNVQSFAAQPRGPLGLRRDWLPWVRQDRCNLLDLFERAIVTDPLPYSKWRDEIDAAGELGTETGAERETVLYLHQSAAHQLALLRSLRMLNAIQTRGPEAGEVDLEELGLPAEAMIDPFTDKPLIVKRLPEGWLVYSIGSNLYDDRGAVDAGIDVGVGPFTPLPATGAPADETRTP